MTIAVANVGANQTFGTWLSITNRLASIASQNTVTLDASTNGSFSTGNGYVVGIFGANAIAVGNSIRGGNVSTNTALNIIANVYIQTVNSNNLFYVTVNSNASEISLQSNNVKIVPSTNTVIGGSVLNINASSTTISSPILNISSNTQLINAYFTVSNGMSQTLVNTSGIYIGNTTSNVVITSNGNVTVGNTLTVIGNMNVSGNLVYNGTSTGNQVPSTNATYSFGNSSFYWLNGYFDSFKIANNITIASKVLVTSNTYTYSNSNTIATVDSFSTSTYRSAEYTAQISDTNGFQMTKLLVIHNGTTPFVTEYGTLTTNTTMGSFSTTISSGTLNLRYTPVSNNVTINLVRTTIAV